MIHCVLPQKFRQKIPPRFFSERESSTLQSFDPTELPNAFSPLHFCSRGSLWTHSRIGGHCLQGNTNRQLTNISMLTYFNLNALQNVWKESDKTWCPSSEIDQGILVSAWEVQTRISILSNNILQCYILYDNEQFNLSNTFKSLLWVVLKNVVSHLLQKGARMQCGNFASVRKGSSKRLSPISM